jgi:L-lysine exporter family protein LysE/ArgO
MFFPSAFVSGIGLGFGLIMAIGAQNAYVIRIGLKQQHVGPTVLVCILVDASLIAAGVAGMGALVQASPLLLGLAKWGGTAFLLWYGVRSWRAVLASHSLAVDGGQSAISLRQAVLTVLALSLLNPHVYLDTVVLLGAIGGHFPRPERVSFALGAICASILWFCLIGFGASKVSPWFARPIAWKWIDGITGSTMLLLALSLALGI